jgi:hypothetical protein
MRRRFGLLLLATVILGAVPQAASARVFPHGHATQGFCAVAAAHFYPRRVELGGPLLSAWVRPYFICELEGCDRDRCGVAARVLLRVHQPRASRQRRAQSRADGLRDGYGGTSRILGVAGLLAARAARRPSPSVASRRVRGRAARRVRRERRRTVDRRIVSKRHRVLPRGPVYPVPDRGSSRPRYAVRPVDGPSACQGRPHLRSAGFERHGWPRLARAGSSVDGPDR